MPTYDASRFEPPAPIATVSLRNPISRETIGEVTMLIDTGADVTFIPQAAVVALKLESSTKRDYRVTTYDGVSSLAKAVEADMLFLGVTLRGLYLVRNTEVGIVGRDVLNRFRIVLNGPELSWQEQPGS